MVNSDKDKKINMKQLEDKLRDLFDKNGKKKNVDKVDDKKEKNSPVKSELDSGSRMIESSLIPSVTSVLPTMKTESLGFDLSSAPNQSGLESNLGGANVVTTNGRSGFGLGEQQKKEEAYQNAKMLYDDSESNRIGAGIRPMRNQMIDASTGFIGVPQRANMINSHPSMDMPADINPIYSTQIKEEKQKFPWEVGVDENNIRKYK